MDMAISKANKAIKGISNLQINNLGVFELFDIAANPTVSMDYYYKAIGAVKAAKLTGFDVSRKYKIRYMARNMASPAWGYRIIISQYNGTAWVDYFDTGTPMSVTEAATGLTYVTKTVTGKTIELWVDYSLMTMGSTFMENNTAGARYVFPESCFVDNHIQTFSGQISSLSSQVAAIPTKPLKMFVSVNNLSDPDNFDIRVKFRYSGTQNMVLQYAKLGINKILGLKGIYFETAPTLTNDFNAPVLHYAPPTDWISPYGLQADSNPLSSWTGATGGNHGTNSAEGFPTAERISTEVFADGAPVIDGQVIGANEVVIRTTHRISAANAVVTETGVRRNSVEEVATYTITPNNVRVSVALTALENVHINYYFGIQSEITPYWGHLYFMEDTVDNYVDTQVAPVAASGTKPTCTADRWIQNDHTGGVSGLLICYTEIDKGIKRDYVADGQSPLNSTTAKVYGHLVRGATPYALATNSTIYWAGGYTFMESLTCPGARNAYFITKGSRRIYCIDFATAVANTKFIPYPEDLNKEVEVIAKSDLVTCGDYIFGDGLPITSMGYGQLKIAVKLS
jgi:hypothetical protein